ncbi:hypothetical protein PPYC1_13520 [Paenibacillus polymyxa]|nr:hypothetical protein PPYC1_13520 [Paenibacillus polymyxa]
MKIYKAFSKFDSSGKIKSTEIWNGLLLQWQMFSADVKEKAPITMSLLKIPFWCWIVQDIDEMQTYLPQRVEGRFFCLSHDKNHFPLQRIAVTM